MMPPSLFSLILYGALALIFMFFWGIKLGVTKERERQEQTIKWLSAIHTEDLQTISKLKQDNTALKQLVGDLKHHLVCLQSNTPVDKV